MLISATLDKRKIFKLKNIFMSKETQKVVDGIDLFNYQNVLSLNKTLTISPQ